MLVDSTRSKLPLAREPRLQEVAREILGSEAVPFHATLFDKSPRANWLVVWHQDTALPLRDQRDVPGWGPWSVKDGIIYARAPAGALRQVVALRIHLDNCTVHNGPLRVLPGTHTEGVLTDHAIEKFAARIAPVDCVVPQGGVLAMKPLLIHASSKSQAEAPRRVLQRRICRLDDDRIRSRTCRCLKVDAIRGDAFV